jgi:hypothetical protein
MRICSAVQAQCAFPSRLTARCTTRTKKDHMRTPVSDRRPRAGMTLTPRNRQSRPLPMSAVAVRRGQFGEFELRPVREHTVEALTARTAPTEG